jgi:hypothetical protein
MLKCVLKYYIQNVIIHRKDAKEIGSDEGGVWVQDFEPVQQNFE